MDETPELRHRRSLGPEGSRRRRALHYTRGFLRPVVVGGLVAFLAPAVFAWAFWHTNADVERYDQPFAYVDVAAAAVGGALAAFLLPAHPRPGEGAKNAAIAAVGAVGAGWGLAWILMKIGRLVAVQDLPADPITLSHEMVRFLLVGAALAGVLGLAIGSRRSSTVREDP